jgi:hypothetical protein
VNVLGRREMQPAGTTCGSGMECNRVHIQAFPVFNAIMGFVLTDKLVKRLMVVQSIEFLATDTSIDVFKY